MPVDAPLKIDLGYLDKKKYDDGISEEYLDQQRVLLARKNESLLNAKKLKDKKYRFVSGTKFYLIIILVLVSAIEPAIRLQKRSRGISLRQRSIRPAKEDQYRQASRNTWLSTKAPL